MTAFLGREELDKNYETIKISIAYNPVEEIFEVLNAAIQINPLWIPNVENVFSPTFNSYNFVNDYCTKNTGTSPELIAKSIQKLMMIS